MDRRNARGTARRARRLSFPPPRPGDPCPLTASAPARPSRWAVARWRSSDWRRSRTASTSPGCRSRSRSCSRTSCAPRQRLASRPPTSRRWRAGTRRPSPARRSPSPPRASSCRTSPACRPSSTWRRCATPWPSSAATRRRSTRSCPPSSSSTTRCRSTTSAPPTPSAATPSSSSSATRSATRSCAGARTRSRTSRSSRPTRASSTRSTSSTWRASCSSTTRTVAPARAYPDTLVGTDSHTTMVNGLGVLGWGVGGIEAEAAMLGQPVSMLIPQVVGFKLHGELPEGATATDLVLTVTELLRQQGRRRQVRRVLRPGRVGAAARRPRDDRQHVPGVRLDLRDLPDRRRDAALPRVHRPSARAQSSSSRPTPRSRACCTTEHAEEPTFSDTLELDLATSCPSLAGPKRPQDRVPLSDAKESFRGALGELRRQRRAGGRRQPRRGRRRDLPGQRPAGRRRSRVTRRQRRTSRPRRRSPPARSSPSTRRPPSTRGWTARRSSSTTATSSSPRSRAARTRRTRR